MTYTYAFFSLGTSDPYLKCVHGQDKLFQTTEKKKTCSPMWAETFITHVDDPFKPITFQVCLITKTFVQFIPSLNFSVLKKISSSIFLTFPSNPYNILMH